MLKGKIANIITSMWETKVGYKSMPLDSKAKEQFLEVARAIEADKDGGLISFFFTKNRAKDTSPHAFIKYTTAKEAQEWKAKSQPNQGEDI